METRDTGRKQEIVLDGENVDLKRKEGESWAQALDRLLMQVPQGKTLSGVLLNGFPATRPEIENLEMEGPFRLEIRTQPLESLLKEVLTDLVAHLDSLMVVFQEIGNNLRRGNLSAVFAPRDRTQPDGGVYMQGLEGMVAAQVLVEEVGRIEKQSGVDSFRPSFIEESDRIESLFSEMLKAQESQDWILLADLVEYEILPVLQRGRVKTSRALSVLLESLRKGSLVVA
ncbi:MAG: hypothetical protein M1537_04715 [Nitrospirae bacterium]|nr:MAG: hypothetical protein D084_Lepto4C00363G0004 [Leptospirillum sp. Group IV 'UBA BS']MCL4485628.1 hypothetical protein [Nitrospirota bacterium]